MTDASAQCAEHFFREQRAAFEHTLTDYLRATAPALQRHGIDLIAAVREADAAAGRVDEVPFSGPHRLVRMLLQAALQAALRQRGLAWGAYELNHALVLALDRQDAQAAWKQGEDPLAEAAVDLEQREAMAASFDEVRHPDALED